MSVKALHKAFHHGLSADIDVTLGVLWPCSIQHLSRVHWSLE